MKWRRMQLHNTQNTEPAECHDSMWELIPWYVNGSLSPELAEEIRSHGKNCMVCAAEIGRQRLLAKGVAKIDPFEVPLSQSWEHLRAQIEAEDHARSPKVGARRRFRGLQGGLVAMTGAVAVVFLFAIVAIPPLDEDFKTLTSEAEQATHIIKFQLAPGVDEERLNRLLAEHGVTLVTGPSEAGVYAAAVPAGTDLEAAADALMATPEVMFAAPEVAQ